MEAKLFYWIVISIIINCVTAVAVKKSAKLENLNNCGGDYSGYQYTITSPNYPEPYGSEQDCVYVFHGSPWAKCNQVFHLQFLNFTVRTSHQCQLDYLEIGDRTVFCGSLVGIRTYMGKNNTLKLRFHSEKGSSDKGFKIRVTTLPCNDKSTPLSNEITKKDCDKESNHKPDDTEPVINYEHIYPVYRPNTVIPLTTDDDVQQNDVKPLKINLNLQPQVNNSPTILKSSALPINVNESFRNNTTPTRISAYFFAQPDDNNDSTTNLLNQSTLINVKFNKSNVPVSQPIDYFLPPTQQRPAVFNHSVIQQNYPLTVSDSRNNQKLIIPAQTYGLPADIPYTHASGLDTQIKTSETLNNPAIDCNGKVNGGPIWNNPSVFRGPTYPATTYGAPGSQFPPVSSIPDFNPGITVATGPAYLPVQPDPRPDGFLPTHNIGNFFPGYPNNNNNINNNIYPIRQCCSNIYSSPRFLLASPGFPSLFDTGNSYECAYTITPASFNICRLRLYFKYFNHGSDDEFCAYGHLEIDGRRYCGCKTGLTVITNVVRNIRVRYVGYPRSKLHGFVIEVTQESCGANGPYLARSKKEIGNETIADTNQLLRTKRDLGYHYSKPKVIFNYGRGQYPNSGVDRPIGVTSSNKCQALSLFDWTLAAKDIHFRGARCITSGINTVPNNPPTIGNPYPPTGTGVVPSFPSGPGIVHPGYPTGPTGPGIINPYPPSGPTYPIATPNIPSWGRCEPITFTEGTVSSPLYPSAYPNNVNKCYRFIRSPNSCRLQLSILDFDVENSPGCTKDYLLFSNQNSRHCGRALARTKTVLDFPTHNVIDLRFVSDSYGTGRGFNIGFMQLPCQVIANR